MVISKRDSTGHRQGCIKDFCIVKNHNMTLTLRNGHYSDFCRFETYHIVITKKLNCRPTKVYPCDHNIKILSKYLTFDLI